MISFKGKLASKTEVQQLLQKDCYTKVPATLVELDISSQEDLEALKNVAHNWRNGDLYATDVYYRFNTLHKDNIRPTDERFFVLTKQTKNLGNLDYSKIMGVAELYKPSDGPIEIEYLQTNPAYVDTIEPPVIKHIGKAIVESFFAILKDKEIALFTTPAAKTFYEKLGFKNIEANLMLFRR